MMDEPTKDTRGPRFGTVSLNNCDQEPIHLPGSVQPHGALIAVSIEDLLINHAGGDTDALLGRSISSLLGLPLSSLLSASEVARITAVLGETSSVLRPIHVFSVSTATTRRVLDVILHKNPEHLILEFEPQIDAGFADLLSSVQTMIRTVQGSGTVSQFFKSIAEQVRLVSGFDRVLVYKFLPDGAGVVEAEARLESQPTYLGLHYPASDIPQQARQLYLVNPIRLIPDVNYKPSPIVSLSTTSEAPLDLSHSILRSVSPLHVEYLKNMGVSASMSLSIVVGGKLWGLVACHHSSPRYVPRSVRIALELFSEIGSYLLDMKLSGEELAFRLERKKALEALLSRLSVESDFAMELAQNKPSLLAYIPSDGVCIWLDGQFLSIGNTPSRSEVDALVGWLNASTSDGVFQTHKLSDLYAPAAAFSAVASGLLALSISRSPRDYVLWFRGELVRHVTWAGNPDKAVGQDDTGLRLSPRKSFEAWKDIIRFQSTPWSQSEVETAQDLRAMLLEVILRRTDQIAREREQARVRQELLLEELDRRIKQWEATAAELKREGQQRAAVEAELSMLLKNTVVEQEAERRRISRELHDTLGQYLAVMQLDLDRMGRNTESTGELHAHISRLKALTDDVGQEVNRLAWVIRPTALDDLGLQTAIQNLLEDLSKSSNLEFDVHLTLNERRLHPSVETALYRVIQEALTNIIKHADATRVGIILEATPNELRLIIEDNGRGFNVDDSSSSSPPIIRFGIRGIRERLASIEGKLEIESALSHGTTLIIHVSI